EADTAGRATRGCIHGKSGYEVVNAAGEGIYRNTRHGGPGDAIGGGAVDDVVRRTAGAEPAIVPGDVDFAAGVNLCRRQCTGAHRDRGVHGDARNNHGCRETGAAIGGTDGDDRTAVVADDPFLVVTAAGRDVYGSAPVRAVAGTADDDSVHDASAREREGRDEPNAVRGVVRDGRV